MRPLRPARIETRLLPATGSSLPALLLGGCAPGSAPALSFFGAYFPSWLIFALIALAFAILSRLSFGIAGLAERVPFPLFTHLAVGILIADLFQLLWLGR